MPIGTLGKERVNNACNTVSRNIGMINKLKHCFPQPTLKSLYYAIVYPYLNYGVLAWGNANKTLMDRLLLLQKKALRIICNSDDTHTRDKWFDCNQSCSLTLLFIMYMYASQKSN